MVALHKLEQHSPVHFSKPLIREVSKLIPKATRPSWCLPAEVGVPTFKIWKASATGIFLKSTSRPSAAPVYHAWQATMESTQKETKIPLTLKSPLRLAAPTMHQAQDSLAKGLYHKKSYIHRTVANITADKTCGKGLTCCGHPWPVRPHLLR